MKKVLLALLLSPALGMGAVIIDELSVKGSGLSEQAAVYDALSHAVRMVRGVEVKTERALGFMYSESGKNEKTKDVWKNSQKIDITSKSNGYIKTYRIVDGPNRRTDGTGWVVDIVASVPRYQALGQKKDHLKRIVLVPFRASKPAYALGAVKIPAGQVSSLFAQKLNEYMIQARKFRVLDREYSFEVDNEKNLLKKGGAPLEDMVRLEQRLGTDYLVVGTIREYTITQKLLKPGFGLPAEVRSTANVILEFKVIEVATQQAVWAGTKNMVYDDKALAQAVPIPDAGPEQYQQALLGLAADEIVNEILDVIYPIKVMDTEGQVVLNQGGKRVRLGTFYKIEGPAKVVVDPDTGLRIKIGGAKTTTIVITEVKPKYSIARIVEGNQDVKIGQICRRAQVILVEPPEKKEK
jgi:curli biogenesis system outer membrane secretion channel CsgG